MLLTTVLVGFLIGTTITDLQRGKIYNWMVYPGMALAVLMSSLATWTNKDVVAGGEKEYLLYAIVPLGDAVGGLVVCGWLMVIIYVFFPGGVGGGDVKLIAMVGGFMGIYQGIEVLLWTFVLAGCAALIILIWKIGAFRLISIGCFKASSRFGRSIGRPAQPEERVLFKMPLYLSPNALVAVIVVRHELVLRFFTGG